MEIKINDATINRPEGHRLIDAPAVQINYADFISRLQQEKAWISGDRNAITVFKTHGITVVICGLHKGAAMNHVQTEGLLMLQVLEGSVTIVNDGVTVQLNAQQTLVLHEGTNSSITADATSFLQLSYIKMVTKPEESIL